MSMLERSAGRIRSGDALKVLGANRIGHGIQAARDPELMAYLKAHTIALDVCLTSNLMTGAWRPVSSNPFGLLHTRGVPLTLSTDDPGLFKTSLNPGIRLGGPPLRPFRSRSLLHQLAGDSLSLLAPFR